LPRGWLNASRHVFPVHLFKHARAHAHTHTHTSTKMFFIGFWPPVRKSRGQQNEMFFTFQATDSILHKHIKNSNSLTYLSLSLSEANTHTHSKKERERDWERERESANIIFFSNIKCKKACQWPCSRKLMTSRKCQPCLTFKQVWMVWRHSSAISHRNREALAGLSVTVPRQSPDLEYLERKWGVNFINILCVHFSYQSALRSFSLVKFWWKKHFRTKNACVKCWWNWPQGSILPTFYEKLI